MPEQDSAEAGNAAGVVRPPSGLAEAAAMSTRRSSNLVQMGGQSLPDVWAVSGVGLSGIGARHKVTKSRMRNPWDQMSLRELCGVCRQSSKWNWFLTWATRMKVVFAGAGCRWQDPDAREWTDRREGHEVARAFAWRAMIADTWNELMVQDNAVVFWRRRDTMEGGEDRLPFLNVLPCESVEVATDGGDDVLKLHLTRRTMSAEALKGFADRHGERYAQAVQSGQPLEIKAWEDDEFDFEVFVRGKRQGGLEVPSMVAILDDLEYLELIRVGDYNGALKRKDVIRQVRKGYAITNGQMAGQNLHHLKRKQKETILETMEKANGATDLVTNFDIGIDYPLIPAEFFNDVTARAAMRRLMNWGGFATLLLQEGLSRIHGVSPYLMNVLRAEMIDLRERVSDFLQDIFENPSFLGMEMAQEAPPLRPIFSNAILYTTDELTKLVASMQTHGLASPQTLRERFLDLDDVRESELMERAHADRERYMPVFESRQGLLERFFPEDYPGAGDGDGVPARQDGGDGGAPEGD